jgi:peptide-methionine (S)-S-oxide reductase
MSSRIIVLALVAVTSLFILRGMSQAGHGKRASTLNQSARGTKLETATFGAGCFWHVEDTFRQIEGVVATAAGFEGGTVANPTYQQVSTDLTGHAEVVQIQFDPAKVPYEKLLEAFFMLHDPTTPNRQGPDIGVQYRSVIFYHSPQQKASAEALKAKLGSNGHFKRPIVTEITPATTFWKAEEYHQQYYEKQRM